MINWQDLATLPQAGVRVAKESHQFYRSCPEELLPAPMVQGD
jgi:hypothetical protein